MFEPNSRYFKVEMTTLEQKDAGGKARTLVYKRRRFIPEAVGETLQEHRVVQGERLDNLTARYLGDPTQFWRVCDANSVLRPEELEEVSRLIRFVLPQP
jgi:hypothetical protein